MHDFLIMESSLSLFSLSLLRMHVLTLAETSILTFIKLTHAPALAHTTLCQEERYWTGRSYFPRVQTMQMNL